MQQGKQLISGGGVPGSSTTVSDEINTSSNIVGPLHWLLYTYQQFIKSGVFETGNTQLVGKNGSFSKEKCKKKFGLFGNDITWTCVFRLINKEIAIWKIALII